ncbi:MAG: hypothetical protein Q7S56_02230 [Nanoarchaeota archaeon]|nr:hypothetical protein [Nanoarchaeota archaeon]
MNFIKKVADKIFDENVHAQFVKFSKGEFRNRAVIKARCVKGKYTINTSAEFANELVRDVAEKVGDARVQITGAIVSTSDLKGKIDFKEIKQFQGVKRYLIEKEMSGKEIVNLIKEFPKAFFALSFKTHDGLTELKIKPKAPKSGKPGSKGEEAPNPDFCKLITNDEKLGKSFVLERPEFKEAVINHTFFVEDIVVPEEMKKEKDFAKVRELAKRKGKIARIAKIDGQEIKSELEFEA